MVHFKLDKVKEIVSRFFSIRSVRPAVPQINVFSFNCNLTAFILL